MRTQRQSEARSGRMHPAGVAAFTLMEMILALGISAVVLVAIGGVFYSGMRLRERTYASIEEVAPVHLALDRMRRDLKNAVPPGGVIGGDFIVGAVESGMSQGVGLQFCTTTGLIRTGSPWGEVQQVIYELRAPAIRDRLGGQDLVRTVTRNLLGTMNPDATDEILLSNVESFDVECYDGLEWTATWDSSLYETNLPTALRVRLQMTRDDYKTGDWEPIEMVVPLAVTKRPVAESTETTGSATTQ